MRCLAGSHPTLTEITFKDVEYVVAHYMESESIMDLYNTEGLGVECSPKCQRCAIRGKDYTIQEREGA